MKRLIVFSVFLLAIINSPKAQTTENYDEYSEQPVVMPPSTCVVTAHKDNLKLTLTIDSIDIGSKTIRTNFSKTIIIGFESDYLKINDSLYIKIFIARNQEYGKKFYTWNWDYLKKRGSKFFSMGKNYYSELEYGRIVPDHGNIEQGQGTYGTPDYIMYHYQYRIE